MWMVSSRLRQDQHLTRPGAWVDPPILGHAAPSIRVLLFTLVIGRWSRRRDLDQDVRRSYDALFYEGLFNDLYASFLRMNC